jgi:uncharacterized protein YjbI with pentapeptide repeats
VKPSAWFAVIFFSANIAGATAKPQTNPIGWSSTEKWVVDQVTAGKDANLIQKFADDQEKRKLSGRFLEDLLTAAIRGFKAHRNGIRIIGAIIDGPIGLGNAEISFEVLLSHCEFRGNVNLTNVKCAQRLSFQESTFRGEGQFATMKVESSADFHKAIFDGKVNFGGANIAKQFNADDTRFTNSQQSADFYSMKVGHALFCRKAVFQGGANFNNIDVASDFVADGAQFRNDKLVANFDSTKVGGSAFFQQAVFEGPAMFSWSKIGGALVMGEVQFKNTEQGVYFNDINVERAAFFTRVIFEGAVNFTRANVAVQFVVMESHFNNKEKEATFSGLKVGSGAFVRGTVFEGPVDFRFADLASFELDETKFQSKDQPVNFSGMHVGHRASFEKVTFEGPADLHTATFDGQLIADDAQFKSTKEVNFNGLKVDSAFFRRTVFEGPVSFCSATVVQSFHATGAQFRSKTGFVCLSLNCGGTGQFESISFSGPTSFAAGSYADLRIKADCQERLVPSLNLNNCSIKRRLLLQGIRIGTLEAASMRVDGPANFVDLDVQDYADLRNSYFEELIFSRLTWPKKGLFSMSDTTYKAIAVVADNDRASYEELLKLPGKSVYSADVYTQLEKFLVNTGNRHGADDIFIAGKRRERREHLHGLSWIGSWLLDWFVGYGRHPERSGYVCLGIVALGCILFPLKKMELQDPKELEKPKEKRRQYNRFWYSLGLFLPVVDLKTSELWGPQRQFRFLRNYVRVHILLGWILVPIFLAAISGLIK